MISYILRLFMVNMKGALFCGWGFATARRIQKKYGGTMRRARMMPRPMRCSGYAA